MIKISIIVPIYNVEKYLATCIESIINQTIKEIEALNGAISNFYNTFKDIRLAMYSDDDFNLYWSWVGKYLEIDDNYKKKAEFYAGRHPFLLDFYNNFCFASKETDDDVIISNLRLEFLNQFSTIQDTLKNENLLDKAIQLVVGPIYDVDKISEEKLLKFFFLIYKESAFIEWIKKSPKK